MQTGLARELDRIGPDATGGSRNHDGLPHRELSVVEQGLPSCCGNDEHAGGFDATERSRFARDHRRRAKAYSA
jgi:hypothetical protein